MSPETCRKLEALVILAMLSVSEGRRISSVIFLNGSPSRGSAFNADEGLEERVYNGPRHERLATNPSVTENAKWAFEQLKAIVDDPDLQRNLKDFVGHIDVIQEQAKNALVPLRSITEDPGIQEKVNHFTEQIHALATHPKVLLHAKEIAEHQTTLLEDHTSSEKEQRAFAAEHLEAIVEDQDVQKHAELASEHLGAILHDPRFQDISNSFADRMQAVMTDAKVQQHLKLASEQLTAAMENPILQKSSAPFVGLIEAMMADPTVWREILTKAISGEQTEITKGKAPSLVEVSRKFIPLHRSSRARIGEGPARTIAPTLPSMGSDHQPVLGGLGVARLPLPAKTRGSRTTMSAIELADRVCPILGVILSNALYFSPLPATLEAVRAGSIGRLNPLPPALMVVGTISWMAYALASRNPWIAASNLPGAAVAVTSLVALLPLMRESKQLRQVQATIVGGAVATLLLWTALIFGGASASARAGALGIFASAVCIVLFASPLSTIAQIIRTRDSSSVLSSLTAAQVLNCVMWTTYGVFAANDIFVWGPNGIGLLLGLAQLALKRLFPSQETTGKA